VQCAPVGPLEIVGTDYIDTSLNSVILKLYRLKVLREFIIRPLLDEIGSSN